MYVSLLHTLHWPTTGPTVTRRPAVTGSSEDLDPNQEPTPKDRNVSVSTNSSESESGILGDNDDTLIVILVVLFLVVPLVALAILVFFFRDRLKPYWNRLMQFFTNWVKCKNKKPVSSNSSAVNFEGRAKSNGGRVTGFSNNGTARGQKTPIYRDNQVSKALINHQVSEKDCSKFSPSKTSKKKEPLLQSSSSAKENPPPYRPPPPPIRPPSIVKSNSGSKSGSKKVRLSTPIQETQHPSSLATKSSKVAVMSSVPGYTSEDENTGKGKILKRESFRGSEISGPVLVCTTNRNSLVLADGNVDIIGPEAVINKSNPVSSSIGGQVKRSQSELGALTSGKPSVTKSASVRAGFGDGAPSLTPSSGFRSRPVPPLPTEEEEDDSLPIYSNEGLGVGDLLSEIQGSLGEQLYNNLPIQETAPPCPPRPERYKPSSGTGTSLNQNKSNSQDQEGTSGSQQSQNSISSAVAEFEKNSQEKDPGSTASSAVKPFKISEPKTQTRHIANNSKAVHRESAQKKAAENNNLLHTELKQNISSQSTISSPKEGTQSSAKNSIHAQGNTRFNNASTHSTPSPSSVPNKSSKTNPVTQFSSSSSKNVTNSHTRPSSAVSGQTSKQSNNLDKNQLNNIAVSREQVLTPSVSSLKAKFNQTPNSIAVPSRAAPKTTSQAKTGPDRRVTDSEISKTKGHVKANQETLAGKTGSKEPGTKTALSQKTGASRTSTDNGQPESEMSASKAISEKNQELPKIAAKSLSGKPIPQEKPGLKPIVTETLECPNPSASSPGKDEQPSGSTQRPSLPPKPREATSSRASKINVPKPATRTPAGTGTQPKQVQSFRI
ncbi:hypothetical protein PoB_006739400 [Plakobranchus ocellatus]|uniref:Uncharacterized protein n=1 Tax=Plakobranchus ocellatus TaxID=259542 RepID=A0AAV4D9S4_9GAST|nr:hypothetical protein PoB_006739400 [Plakobranchus ocellatus]